MKMLLAALKRIRDKRAMGTINEAEYLFMKKKGA